MRVVLSSLIIFTMIAVTILPIAGDARSETDPALEKSDTARQIYPEKRKSKGALETMVSIPGRVISIPFDLVLTGSGAIAGWIDENQITDKLKNLATFHGGQVGVRFKYSSEGGVGPDLFIKDLLNEGSRIHLTAGGGVRGRQSYRLALSRVRLGADRVMLRLSGGYFKYPDEAFFGIGPDTGKDQKMDFLLESGYFTTDAVIGLGGGLEFSMGAGIEKNSVTDGKNAEYPGLSGSYGSSELPGMKGGLGLASVRAGLFFNNIPRCRAGTLISVSGDISTETGGEEYGFSRLMTEVRQKLPLFHDRYLLLRVLSSFTEPAPGREIPFYRLSEIGRRETMRGYQRGRFRDSDMLVGSIEYHYPVWAHSAHSLETFIFSDAGQVAKDIQSDISKDDIKITYGGGLAMVGEDGELLRAVIGFTEEGFNLYFTWN